MCVYCASSATHKFTTIAADVNAFRATSNVLGQLLISKIPTDLCLCCECVHDSLWLSKSILFTFGRRKSDRVLCVRAAPDGNINQIKIQNKREKERDSG